MTEEQYAGESFDVWLRAERDRQGLTNSDIARAMGVWPSLVGKWARGEQIPRPPQARKLADALGKDQDYVLVKAGHRKPPPELGDFHQRAGSLLTQIPEELVALAIPTLEYLAQSHHAEENRELIKRAANLIGAQSGPQTIGTD